MKLRDYQKRIIKSSIENLKTQKKSLIVLPTGAGKTVIFSHIINNLKVKTLVIAHTNDLVEQIKNSIFNLFPNLINLVEVKTIQSLNKKIIDFELLIIDECHKASSQSYKRLLKMQTHAMHLGVTATPFRLDKKSIYELFGFPEETFTLIDMIKEGFLCDFKGYRVKTNISISDIKKIKGDFNKLQLSSVINVIQRNQIIVSKYLELANKLKAVAFCSSIDHAKDLCKEFKKNNILSECISGQNTKQERKKILQNFKNGEIQVLCNCNLLTEGFDEPSIECLIMAKPTISKGLYIQMIGRGARLFPGKKNCTVIEFTDNCFDVCFLDILLNKKNNKFIIKNGETLLESEKRLKKSLVNFEGNLITEDLKIIVPKSIYERPATVYQIKLLNKMNINYELPLTEFMANQLIGN